MKFRWHILSICLLQPFFTTAAAQTAPLAESGGPVDGNALVLYAAEELLRQPALEAKIRKRVDMFDQQLVGVGSYQQLATADVLRYRWELKLQAAGEVTSILHVCDGRFLWIRNNLPRDKRLSRIDLRRIRQAEEAATSPGPTSGAPEWMKLGGLPHLLAGLHENFQFTSPSPDMVGKNPVWRLRGAWKSAQPPGAARPPQTPDSVEVILGRDNVAPLFPYRVEFFRNTESTAQDGAGTGKSASKPIVTLELFELLVGGRLDPANFTYTPGDQKVNDLTETVLKRLGLPEQKLRSADQRGAADGRDARRIGRR